MDGHDPGSSDVHKIDTTRLQRLTRLIGAVLDPRSWAHAIKIVNYYNYSHVQQVRKARIAGSARISPTVSFANGQNIEIGERVRIGANCTIWAGPRTGRIVIGDDCMFGPNVMMTASSYRYNEGSPVTRQPMKEADVRLGRDVWIGYGAVILPGAEIGDGVVIGAGAVVRGTVPAYSVVASELAKVITTRRKPGGDGDTAA
jgi:acetyltransferase-like isoleucine patch superfamily enzyme